jgi:hypothetical protein
MESSSHAYAQATRAAGPVANARRLLNDWDQARTADLSLLIVPSPRLNLLLVGMDAGVSKLLETLLLNLRDPISTWLPNKPLVLPPAAATGTLILHEVGTLGYEDQLRLLYWLERSTGRIQVVSTSTAPLLPRVQSGAFIDTLYYRLNTICVDVEMPPTF